MVTKRVFGLLTITAWLLAACSSPDPPPPATVVPALPTIAPVPTDTPVPEQAAVAGSENLTTADAPPPDAPTLAVTEIGVAATTEALPPDEGFIGPLAVIVDGENSQAIVVDPTGLREDIPLAAPGLRKWGRFYVTGQYIFYYDEDSKVLRRIDPFGDNDVVLDVVPVDAAGFFNGSFLPAPDGDSVAIATTEISSEDAFLTISRLVVVGMDGRERVAFEQEWREDQRLPQPVGWSPDGRYLYFTNQIWGIGGYILFWGGPDLWRLDTNGGATEAVLPDMQCLCAMAISPDGQYLAWIDSRSAQLTLHIHTLATAIEVAQPLPGGVSQAGAIAWNPSSTAFLYTEAIGDFTNESYSIAQVDLQGTIRYLLEDDDSLRRSAAWFTETLVGYNDDLNFHAWLVDITNPNNRAQLSLAQPWMEARP